MLIKYQISRATLGSLSPNKELAPMDDLADMQFRSLSRLDNIYKYDKFNWKKVRTLSDPVSNANKKLIEEQYGAQYVSNAWFKLYELLSEYKPIEYAGKKKMRVFLNAEMPGSFIMALLFYTDKKVPGVEIDWEGSAYYGGPDSLEDSYGLYRNYKDKWIQDKLGVDGDLLNIDVLKAYTEYFDHSVDLYTSDAATKSADGEEEKTNMHINFMQVIHGICTLRQGGVMITKQFTSYSSLNQSLICALTNLFEKVSICKPATSRKLNSEVYIVCEGFYGYDARKSLIDYMVGFAHALMGSKALSWDIAMLGVTKVPKELTSAIEFLLNRQARAVSKLLWMYTELAIDGRDRDKRKMLESKYRRKNDERFRRILKAIEL